jgi:hypothetical protein
MNVMSLNVKPAPPSVCLSLSCSYADEHPTIRVHKDLCRIFVIICTHSFIFHSLLYEYSDTSNIKETIKDKVYGVFKHHAMKANIGSIGKAPRILKLGTRWE